jgi:hypothetical protein
MLTSSFTPLAVLPMGHGPACNATPQHLQDSMNIINQNKTINS